MSQLAKSEIDDLAARQKTAPEIASTTDFPSRSDIDGPVHTNQVAWVFLC
jgi:hypothetical protein